MPLGLYLPALKQVGPVTWLRCCLRNWSWTPGPGPVRVWMAIADHFEPLWKADDALARSRVAMWRDAWPGIADRCRDSTGRPARYTFFYPAEIYRPELIAPLAEMAHRGIADVEVHLHHEGETQEQFRELIGTFVETLHRDHGLFRRRDGRLAFAFIHGDWALDNSLPNGQYCGLDNELTLLADLGCYADFTMPSGESPTQARLINQIYWATDDPDAPKSYDRGIPVRPGQPPTGGLLMIPGPFGVRATESWLRRAPAMPPVARYRELLRELRLETGELAGYDRPAPSRVRRWFDLAPRIGNDLFVKLYSHGAQERNSSTLLAGDLEHAYQWVAEECQRRGWEYYFVTTWQMFRAVEAVRERRDPVAAVCHPLNGEEHPVRKGSIVHIPPGVVHSAKGRMRVFVVGIPDIAEDDLFFPDAT